MLSPIASVPYSQKPCLPTAWLSGLENVRYKIQSRTLEPVYLIAAAIFAAILTGYIYYRRRQSEAVSERDRALVDAGSEDAKPLRRVENMGKVGRVAHRWFIDPLVSNVLPDDDALLTSRVLENLDEHSHSLNHYVHQATYSGASSQSAGYNDMPPGFKHSEGLGGFSYHEADSIFNLMVGFIVPKESLFERKYNEAPVEVINQTQTVIKEIKDIRDRLLEFSRFYGFLVEGAAEASYVHVHANHRVKDKYASWNHLIRPEKELDTSVMLFYTITFDRELNYLPEEVRRYLFDLSKRYQKLYELFLPETLDSIQFRLDEVKGPPPACPPHSEFSKEMRRRLSVSSQAIDPDIDIEGARPPNESGES